MTTITIADRYSALGPPSTCKGPCEGTGWVPVHRDGSVRRERKVSAELSRRWEAAEKAKPTKDGWHFVACPRCKP
jgi:hypothetical protein